MVYPARSSEISELLIFVPGEGEKMSSRSSQAVLWFVLWISFTIATRKFHPTIVIAASATGCLELASASAVYWNELLLVPKLLVVRRFFSYACRTISVCCVYHNRSCRSHSASV